MQRAQNIDLLSHFAAMLLAAPKRGPRRLGARPKDRFRGWCGLRRARLNTVVGETHAAKERRLGRAGAHFLERMIRAGVMSSTELERRMRLTHNLPPHDPSVPSDNPRLEQASRGRA